MKSNRSEYQTQQDIIRGFKPRRIVQVPQGKARAFNLLVWLLVGFCTPFALVGIVEQWINTH